MSAGAIGGAAAGLRTTSSGGTGFAELGSDQFMRVLMSELTNQDPLKPTDSTALLEQLSSLRNIESQLSLQKTLETLVVQNSVASASTMIGKYIAGLNQNNEAIQGLVISVRIQDGEPILQLDSGRALPASRVTEIVDPAMFEDLLGEEGL